MLVFSLSRFVMLRFHSGASMGSMWLACSNHQSLTHSIFQGTQHKRKAEQFFQQYQYNQRKQNSFNESRLSEDISKVNGSRHTYLHQLYRNTTLVGLQYVEAYKSDDRHDPPLYMCILTNCKVNNSVSNITHLRARMQIWVLTMAVFYSFTK